MAVKKTALAVLALGVSGVASAAMYTPAPAPAPACTPGNVTVPCERSAWDLGIEGIYVETTSGPNFYYSQNERTVTGTITGSVFTRNDLDPGYRWGWRLQGSYHWGTGSDVNINWMHFNKDNGALAEDTINNNLVTHFIDSNVTGAGVTIADAEVDTKFDQVNFEFGQHADFGQYYNVRFHFGFQYARVDVDTAVALADSSASALHAYANESKFDGLGLRGGLDTSYDFGNGFSVEGKTAAALLVGDLKSTAALSDIPNDQLFVWEGKQRAVVPELEALFDVKYTHGLANGDMAIYAGWRFVNYFDVVQTTFETNEAVGGAADMTDVRVHNNNFGFHGPMIGFTWVGNV